MRFFGVWCAKCVKYLAFDTYDIAATDALKTLISISHKIREALLAIVGKVVS